MSTAEFPDEETDLNDEVEEDVEEDTEIEDLSDLDGDDLAIDDSPVVPDDLDDDIADTPDDDEDDKDGDDDKDGEDDEDDEDEDEDDEDDEEEESLDVLLAREKVIDDDLGSIVDEPRDGLTIRPALVGAGEFTCRSCYLVKRRAQLADEKRMLCFDCV